MTKEDMEVELASLLKRYDPTYMYSDDFSFFSEMSRISARIAELKTLLKG